MAKRYNLKYSSRTTNTMYRNNYKKKRKFLGKMFFILIVIILSIVSTVLITGLNNKPTKSQPENTNQTTETENTPTVNKITYKTTSDTTNLPKSNKAVYGIVVDKTNNTIVAQRKAHKRAYPASTTKIMTLLVAVENIEDMNKTFTMSYEITDPLYVAGASVAGFKNNEVITMTDLLYGTILPSGADAAQGLAISVAGSEEKFVELMNQKVAELELENTHFDNVTGLYSENNYSSVYDMAVILDAAMQNKLCREILSTYQHTTEKTSQNPDGILLSSTLFNYMYGTEPETATILGGKTGYLTESGYCIASFGKSNQNQNEYIVVTFDSPGLWPAFNGQIDLYKQFAK